MYRNNENIMRKRRRKVNGVEINHENKERRKELKRERNLKKIWTKKRIMMQSKQILEREGKKKEYYQVNEENNKMVWMNENEGVLHE